MKNKPLLTAVAQVAACVLGFLLLPHVSALAETYTWSASGAGTWSTSAANWNDGVTSSTNWVNGNDAVFNGFSSNTSISLGTNVGATSLSVTGIAGTGTVQFSANSIDVPILNISGVASIDMYSKLTGSHGFTYNGTGSGRLNLKAVADYTGDTVLTGTAYILSDNANNVLATATTLNLGASTTFRMAASKSQQVGLLTGSGTVLGQGSAAGNVSTFTINTGAGASGVYSGTIRVNSTTNDTLHLVVSGSGTQTLNGTNSYNGTTTVSGGKLVLGSNLSASSQVTVSGGTLSSNVANVNLGVGAVLLSTGSIAPGDIGTAGKFTLAASKNFSATGGTINFDLGTSFDQILGSGTGTFSLTDTVLSLNLISGFDYGLTYTVFSGFSSGSITNLSIIGYDTSGGRQAFLDNTGTLSFSSVPEPSTSLLVMLGLVIGLALRHRWNREQLS